MDEVDYANVSAASLSYSPDAVSTTDMGVPAVGHATLSSVSISTASTPADTPPSVMTKVKQKL